MASGMIANPGTKLGPCRKQCEHRDCAENRALVAKLCRICGKPIGYMTSFFQEDNWASVVHADCALDEVDRERATLARVAR